VILTTRCASSKALAQNQGDPMSEEVKPKLDEFTTKVVSDPAKPQETLLLQGFLGASSQPDHTRVYSDITLESYVDVANADIIHVEPLPKETSPMGGSYLWVKKETEVLPGTGTGEPAAKANFLQGPIATEAAKATIGVTQPVQFKTVPLVACLPTILVRACAPSPLPHCFVQTPACPTRPVICDIAVSGGGPCNIPDPTIQEQTVQFQPAPAAAPAAFGFAAPQEQAFGTFPSATCPTAFCPAPTRFHCPIHTPGCPQVIHPTQVVAACHPTFAVSVCHICPTQTINGPECPVHTPFCPQQAASIACGEHQTGVADFALAAGPALPASVAVAQCPVTVATRPCPPPPTSICPTPQHRCPSQLCPTPLNQCPTVNQFHCPTVAGFECPTVNRFHCPSVAGFDCPSVNEFHCPSINNFNCPPRTSHAADCPPTPQIQHCPTPNMICPRPTSLCQSVAEVCPTTSPLFC
jgi:hypothetical protein